MKYLKKDLVDIVTKDTGFYKKDVKEVIDSMLGSIPRMLTDESDRLILKHFGSFKCFNYKEKHVRNPKTNKIIMIPQHKIIKFTASEVIYNECNKETY